MRSWLAELWQHASTFWRAIIASATAIVLAAAGYGISVLVSYLINVTGTCMNQGVTVVLHQGPSGECIGITDGSFVFDPALATVEKQIRAEDMTVTGDDYVTVAYLLPVSPGGILPVNGAAEELEGAYAAQHDANHGSDQGTRPLIKLLIANPGQDADQYQALDRLIGAAIPGQHLVAVAGIGVSLDATVAEVHELAGGRQLAVIGSTVTATAFDNITGFIRVVPSNAANGKAAVTFAERRAARAFLIEDLYDKDDYDLSLLAAFKTFPRQDGPDTYNSHIDPGSARTTLEQRAPDDICTAQPDIVLFAGRGRELAILIEALASRACQDKKITIVTGDDVTDMLSDPRQRVAVTNALSHRIVLYFSGLATPAEWDGASCAAAVQGYGNLQRFEKAYSGAERQAGTAAFDDGNAIMGYDAMLTAIKAIRQAAAGPEPSAQDVQGALSTLHGGAAVPGASGQMQFWGDYLDGQGSNPRAKAIPILRLLPADPRHPQGSLTLAELEAPGCTRS